jgi:hypothetical protein
MCHVLPVLMVLCLAGAGLAIWQTVGKQQPRPVAVPAGEPLTFSVNIKLPQDGAGSTCSGLFYQGKNAEGGTVVSYWWQVFVLCVFGLGVAGQKSSCGEEVMT